MIRASLSHPLSLLVLLAAAPLAACGDDSTGTGGAGGASSSADTSTADASTSTGQGGDDGSSSSGTGGDDFVAELAAACTSLCEAYAATSDELACGDTSGCETTICEDLIVGCEEEQIAVYQCLGNDLSATTCACEEPGDLECDDICDAQSEALDDCEAAL